MYTEERADAGSLAVEVEGRRGASLGAGEKLRVDAVWKDDMVDAVSVKAVDLWAAGLWLVDGRRGSASSAGDIERERGGEARRLVGMTFMDSRCASSAFFSLWAGPFKMLATEADRCCNAGRSPTGERQSSSTTLGRPACAYDTIIAMSQLLPLFHLDIDIVLALDSFMRSCTTTSS
jgi:hypothetical protein